MAETHGNDDPEAAPMHHDIDERFTQLHVGAAAVLGIVAIVLGIVFGITLANN